MTRIERGPSTVPHPPAAIAFEDVTLGYERHPAVHHLDGEVAAGSLCAVVGPNGGGKSTLLMGIAGLLRPLAGVIRTRPAGPGQVAYLPQRSTLDPSFPMRLWDLVSLGLWHRIGIFRPLGREDRARVTEALAAVGLESLARRPLATLSGGQLQRALLARLLVQDAPIVLLDEPFTALDAGLTQELVARLETWPRHGKTVVAVTHDLDQVRRHFPRTLLLAREPVAWGETAEVLTPENLERARLASESFDAEAGVCARPAEAGDRTWRGNLGRDVAA